MVLVNGLKFACQSCIKGHRSTKCTHTARPLVEIKKKGRPTSQCSHCRDLRKTRSVHGKCDCAERELEEKPQKVVLPNGVTDLIKIPGDQEEGDLEDGQITPSSGKKKGGVRVAQLLNPCNCRRGGKCNCCTVVDRSKKSRLSIDSTTSSPAASSPTIPKPRSRSGSRTRFDKNKGGCCSRKSQGTSGNAPTPSQLPATPMTMSSDAFSPVPSTSSFTFSTDADSPAYPAGNSALPFASTSYLPAVPTPLSQTYSQGYIYPMPTVQSPSILGPTTQLGGCIGDDPTCTLLLAHLQATAPPPTAQENPSAQINSTFSNNWSSTPFAQSFIPHQTPLFLPHTQGTSYCFCGDTCSCVGCPQHDPLGQKKTPSHEPGPGCGCRNRAAQSAPPPLMIQTQPHPHTTQLQPHGKRTCCRTNTNAQVPSEVSSIDELLQSVMDMNSTCGITGTNQCAMSLPGLWNEGGNEQIAANLPGVNDVWSRQVIANDPWFASSIDTQTPQALPLFIAPEQRQKRKAKAQSVWALEPLPESIDPWATNSLPTSLDAKEPEYLSSIQHEANGCASMYGDIPVGEPENDETLEPGCGDQCTCASTCACRTAMNVDDDDDDVDEDDDEAVDDGSILVNEKQRSGSNEDEGGVPTSQMAATSLNPNQQVLAFSFEGFSPEDIEGAFDRRDQQGQNGAMAEFVAAGFC